MSAIVGGVFAFLGAIVAQWMTSVRQRKQQRIDFQRETLAELQEDLVKIYRGASKNEDYTQPWRRSTILTVRVKDETVRNLVAQFKEATEKRDQDTMGQIFDQVNNQIGEILRALD